MLVDTIVMAVFLDTKAKELRLVTDANKFYDEFTKFAVNYERRDISWVPRMVFFDLYEKREELLKEEKG